MAVADADFGRGTGSQKLNAGGRVAAQDRFGVHFFAELVHAAIGKNAAAQNRLRFFEIEVRFEVPRPDAVVPVARRVRDVAILLRSDDEVKVAQFRPTVFVFFLRLAGLWWQFTFHVTGFACC